MLGGGYRREQKYGMQEEEDKKGRAAEGGEDREGK